MTKKHLLDMETKEATAESVEVLRAFLFELPESRERSNAILHLGFLFGTVVRLLGLVDQMDAKHDEGLRP